MHRPLVQRFPPKATAAAQSKTAPSGSQARFRRPPPSTRSRGSRPPGLHDVQGHASTRELRATTTWRRKMPHILISSSLTRIRHLRAEQELANLRRHERDRSGGVFSEGSGRINVCRDPQIRDSHRAALGQQNVRRLQVSVDHSTLRGGANR